MSVLQRLSCSLNRRDEVPNQELARQIVIAQNRAGVQELREALTARDPNLRSDALKTLYEIGYLDPSLVADCVEDLLYLLADRNNRMVWGAMIGLSTIAALRAERIFQQRAVVQRAMAKGSVITVDGAIKTLAVVAADNDQYRQALAPDLLQHLASCRPKDVPQHAESILPAIDATFRDAYVAVLEKRLPQLSPSQAVRVRRVINKAKSLS
jgi:hypothetical protein